MSQFSPDITAKDIFTSVKTASLCTLDRDTGHPIATLTNIAMGEYPCLLLSSLAHHTANIAADNRCSLLMIKGGKGDALAHPRLTIIGRAEKLEKSLAREDFLKIHPKAKLYVDFADFSFYQLIVESVWLNGGFGKAAVLEWEQLKHG